MKISLNWLKEYVDLPSDLTPDKLAYDLTMSTVEVEDIISLASTLDKICIGHIKEIKQHPNADRLKIVITDIGLGELKEIICGGSNLEVGMKVAVSMPGAMVRWHGEGDLVEVKETKIRGSKSFGMICAATEIGLAGLFPANDDKEIIDLSFLDAEPGQQLAKAIAYDDYIIDIDNKSLSNRPDLWGHYGLAREIAAIYSLNLKELKLDTSIEYKDKGKELSAKISDSLCSRYSAVVIEGVVNSESPLWLKSLLSRVGQKPISLLVDITNYVMLTVGQPTHVFDFETLDKGIEVRKASKGEKIKLLDGSDLKLRATDLVISDASKAIALAGIMGGDSTGASPKTNKIVFEAANFDSVSTRKMVGFYGIRTESSMRFEKSLDPQNVQIAQSLLLRCLRDVQSDVKVCEAIDIDNSSAEVTKVEISKSFIESRIGQELDENFLIDKLSRLGFKVDAKNSEYTIEVPSWRSTGDVSIKQDIVEEVARMMGYDSLKPYPISVTLSKPKLNLQYAVEKDIRNYLSLSARLQEIVTYPWVKDKYVKDGSSKLGLQDPPDPKQKTLKSSLVPNMLWAISENVKFTNDFGLFEISRVFLPESQSKFSADGENLPHQPKYLSFSLVAKDAKETFLEVKGIVGGLFSKFNLKYDFTISKNKRWGSQVCLDVIVNGNVIGTLALFDSKFLSSVGIDRVSVSIFEMNLDKFIGVEKEDLAYKKISKYPTAEYDLAILFDDDVLWHDVKKKIVSSDKLIKQVLFQDEYTGKQVPDGKKSLAFKMIMADEQATLESKQIDSAAAKVIKGLNSEFGGTLRDS